MFEFLTSNHGRLNPILATAGDQPKNFVMGIDVQNRLWRPLATRGKNLMTQFQKVFCVKQEACSNRLRHGDCIVETLTFFNTLIQKQSPGRNTVSIRLDCLRQVASRRPAMFAWSPSWN